MSAFDPLRTLEMFVASALMLRLATTVLLAAAVIFVPAHSRAVPPGAAIDAAVHKAMQTTGAQGLALAVIDDGKVRYVKAFGKRNANGERLRTDTVMYGASLTKTVFAYTVLRLVDRGALDLDKPIAAYLDKSLPDYDPESIFPDKYGPYRDLKSDDRWRKITPRMALTHSTGFANFWWLEPDKKLRINFEPGSRYAYSGEGLILLQFAIEQGRKDLGLAQDVGNLTQAIFDKIGMKRTSLQWRSDFRPNLADGFKIDGEVVEHDERSKVRAAGSMDTTIADLSKFVAALVRGDGLSRASRAELTKPQLHIGSSNQFPSLVPELPVEKQRKDLYAGLGLIVFQGPQGKGFFKGGHDDQTANTMVCLEASKRCVLILSNDVRAEAAFPPLVHSILGETGVPYEWEYGPGVSESGSKSSLKS